MSSPSLNIAQQATSSTGSRISSRSAETCKGVASGCPGKTSHQQRPKKKTRETKLTRAWTPDSSACKSTPPEERRAKMRPHHHPEEHPSNTPHDTQPSILRKSTSTPSRNLNHHLSCMLPYTLASRCKDAPEPSPACPIATGVNIAEMRPHCHQHPRQLPTNNNKKIQMLSCQADEKQYLSWCQEVVNRFFKALVPKSVRVTLTRACERASGTGERADEWTSDSRDILALFSLAQKYNFFGPDF